MRHLRAGLRIAAILLVTSVLYTIWSLGKWLISDIPARLSWRDRLVEFWGRRVVLIIGLSIEQTGTAPDPPFCLVCNHLSYVDILIMLARTNGTLIAKADVRDWPLIGYLAREIGTIFLDRESSRDLVRVGRLIEECIDRDEGVTFFPEGTSTRGINVGRFKSSLFDYPAGIQLPVHHATISYSTKETDAPASEIVCWWGGMTLGNHLYNLLTIQGFTAQLHFGEHPISNSDRKQLAALLHERVSSSFTPVRQADRA